MTPSADDASFLPLSSGGEFEGTEMTLLFVWQEGASGLEGGIPTRKKSQDPHDSLLPVTTEDPLRGSAGLTSLDRRDQTSLVVSAHALGLPSVRAGRRLREGGEERIHGRMEYAQMQGDGWWTAVLMTNIYGDPNVCRALFRNWGPQNSKIWPQP